MVRSRYSLGMLPIRSWYSTLKVHSRLLFSPKPALNLVHALYNLLFAVWSRCGQVLSGYAPSSLVVRYTQGSLRLVFLTSLEPGTRTVCSIIRVAQSRLCWIRFGRFRRDNFYYRYPDTLLYCRSGQVPGRCHGPRWSSRPHMYLRPLGVVEVLSWCGRGTLMVRSRYACGAVEVRSRCG